MNVTESAEVLLDRLFEANGVGRSSNPGDAICSILNDGGWVAREMDEEEFVETGSGFQAPNAEGKNIEGFNPAGARYYQLSRDIRDRNACFSVAIGVAKDGKVLVGGIASDKVSDGLNEVFNSIREAANAIKDWDGTSASWDAMR